MEVDNTATVSTSRKRTVNADNPDVEVSDPKRPRINLNNETKRKVLLDIVNSSFEVLNELKLNAQFNNITVGHQIMSVIQGGHNILRKIANYRMTSHPSQELNATITTMGTTYNIKYSKVTELMKIEATKLNLEYTLSNRTDNTHWFGVANPLFNILSAFKMRYDEIRVGVSRIPIGKSGDTTNYIDVAQYGLTPAHHVLLEGSTHKPERRSAMVQSLGPLTAMLAAYKAKEPYRQKWVDAVKRDLTHIPNSFNLCSAMLGKRAEEVAPALSAFADVILIAGSRNAQRAFFPLNFIPYVLGNENQLKRCGASRTTPYFSKKWADGAASSSTRKKNALCKKA